MNILEYISIIGGCLGIAGAVFGSFVYFRTPQEKSEVNDAVFDEKFDSLKELVINLRDNHLHSIDSKLDKHIEDQTRNELIVAGTLGSISAKLDMITKRK